jgi:hypothetical protein
MPNIIAPAVEPTADFQDEANILPEINGDKSPRSRKALEYLATPAAG